MKQRIKKGASAPKKEKNTRGSISPITEPALPLLLCTVTFIICFILLVIDRFVFPLGKEPLSPIVSQLAALVFPAYLVILLTCSDKSAFAQMREIGFRALRAQYVFFIIFSSLFAMSASLILTLAFGGANEAANGMTLLGVFTAGENEFSVSILYLIFVYAVIPALCEEFFFRGVVFSQLEKVSFPFAAAVSAIICTLFGFSLGAVMPTLFVCLVSVFLLYTTKSLWACVIMHFLFNLYRLFLEANIATYFLSSRDNTVLVITIILVLLISSLLFFAEGARIFRKRAASIANKKAKSNSKFVNISSLTDEVRASLAYTPTLVFSLICLTVFIATTVINYIV